MNIRRSFFWFVIVAVLLITVVLWFGKKKSMEMTPLTLQDGNQRHDKRHPHGSQCRKRLHVTGVPCPKGEEFLLIIPNASMPGPPTSGTVQVNHRKALCGFFTRIFLLNRVRNATAPVL
jgi:hypothetical protein